VSQDAVQGIIANKPSGVKATCVQVTWGAVGDNSATDMKEKADEKPEYSGTASGSTYSVRTLE
jgi:hypothetical protein